MDTSRGAPLATTSMTSSQRYILGALILFLVDLIWVLSSELTKFVLYNYNNEKSNSSESFTFESKPFFCTYVKTSMFTLYLATLVFWRNQSPHCRKPMNEPYLQMEQEDDNFYAEDSNDNAELATEGKLSTPVFVPVKTSSDTGNESSDESSSFIQNRSVRFHKMAEVRQMADAEASAALLARLSYQASLNHAFNNNNQQEGDDKFCGSVENVAKISLIFCFLFFLANYNYQLALAQSESSGVMNIFMATSSSFFTLILSAVFPSTAQGDRFTLSKLVFIALSVFGITLLSMPHGTIARDVPLASIFSLLSAFFYSAYLVFLKRKVRHESNLDIPLFFGFLGLFNLLLLWPIFFLLHYTKIEPFEWPSKQQLSFLFLNGLLGTVISEALWLWGCFLTSALVATVAKSLTIPLSIMTDVFLKMGGYPKPSLFYVGTLPVFVAFVLVAYLSRYDNWDPVFDFFQWVYFKVCDSTFRRGRPRFADEGSSDLEQREALIGIDSTFSTNSENEA